MDISVEGPGTGDGFKKFCAGETDISDASRPIEEEEIAECEKAGIEFIELKIAFDGISVLTAPDNPVECLSFADLYALIGPEAEGFGKWTDATELAAELGSDTEFPDENLDLTGPGEESGTYDSFIEIAFGDIAEARLEEGKITEDQAETTRPDYQASANDNTIIQNIEGSSGSLGWVGLRLRRGCRRPGEGGCGVRRARRRVRRPERRDDRRRELPAVPLALHLREQGEGREQRGGGRPSSTSTWRT